MNDTELRKQQILDLSESLDFNDLKSLANTFNNIIEREKVNIKDEMFNLFDSYENCEDIIDDLRSQESNGTITERQYDYAMENWESILNEWKKEQKQHGNKR